MQYLAIASIASSSVACLVAIAVEAFAATRSWHLYPRMLCLLPEHERYVGNNWVLMLYRRGNVRASLGLVSGVVLYVSYIPHVCMHTCMSTVLQCWTVGGH